MKFSIIVPVYNTEKYLKECLDSLINQTYRDFEIILVDDGSTDSSSCICDMYAEQNPDKIKVIHKPNGGLISARVTGNKYASGEYILNVDSDDFADTDMLKIVNEKLTEYDMPELLIFSFSHYSDNKIRDRIKTFSNCDRLFCGEEKKEIYECLISTSLINSMCTKAVRRTVINSNPTDYSEFYDKNMGEDMLQSLFVVTHAESILYINDSLYFYRDNHDSISKSFSVEMLDKNTMTHIYFEALKYLDIWNLKTESNINKLNANFLSYAVYTFDRFYINAKTDAEKRTILYYDWTKYVTGSMTENLNDNPYVSDGYKMLWKMISEKNFLRTEMFYLRKKAKKKLKSMSGKI